MKRLLILAMALLLSGCAVASIKITHPDGTQKEATISSFCKDFDKMAGDFQAETFRVAGSSVSLDLETIIKILQAAQ